MSDGTGETLLDRARGRAAVGDWQQAYDLLVRADADGLLCAADLPLLAEVAYAAGHLDVTIEVWERAYAEGVRAGDQLAAAGAAVRVAMHLLFDTALMAPVRGWLTRAERLLGERGETPVDAWLAVVPSAARGRRSRKRSAPCSTPRHLSSRGRLLDVAFDEHTVPVRDLKGMRYLARLLAEPGREFDVLDLVAAERGQTAAVGRAAEPGLSYSGLGDAGPLLDARAKEAYRRRLAEVEDDIGEALAMGDDERAAQADVERNLLIRELSRAVGLGGRDRRAAAASERARASVTRAVRQAIARIREHHPSLGTHLDRAIRTGTYCAYLPDPRAAVEWRI